jgi:hypothetical protein
MRLKVWYSMNGIAVGANRGTYLAPELYGQPKTAGLGHRPDLESNDPGPVGLDHYQRLGDQMTKQIEDPVTINAAPAADQLSWI